MACVILEKSGRASNSWRHAPAHEGRHTYLGNVALVASSAGIPWPTHEQLVISRIVVPGYMRKDIAYACTREECAQRYPCADPHKQDPAWILYPPQQATLF